MSVVVKKTQELQTPKLKVLVYGHPGVGKTFFAGTAGKRFKPIFVSAESGLLSLNKIGNFDFVEIKQWAQLQEIYNFLMMQGHAYDTVILDSLSEMQKICEAQVLKDTSKENEVKEALVQKDWGLLATRMQSMVRAFRDMNLNVIMTCLASEKTDESSGLTHTGPLLSGSTRDLISAFFDEVFYLGIKTGKDKEGKQVSKRYLQTSGSETIVAKDRSGMLPTYVEPDFTKVYDLIFNNQTKGE